jgi:cell division protein FtsW
LVKARDLIKSLKIDFWLFSAVMILCGMGLVIIYSSSGPYAVARKLPEFYYMKDHLTKLIMGFVLMILALMVPVNFWRKISRPMWILALLFLCAVLIPGVGKTLNGAQRWLNLGFITFQPSEFAKFAVIMAMALKWEETKAYRDDWWKGFLQPLLFIAGPICLLILKQPNFSMVASILVICMVVAYAAEVHWKHLLMMAAPALPILAYVAIAAPYRLKRIQSFWDANSNVEGSYQQLQSLISLGHGGLFGTGFGEGTQRLGYLPMPFTDTIYAVLGEELGFLRGTLVVLVCFGIIIWRGVEISRAQSRSFESYLALGITMSLTLNVIVHVGVCTRIIPATGQTLPLISYGGTSLLMNMAAMGILLSLSKPQEHELTPIRSRSERYTSKRGTI